MLWILTFVAGMVVGMLLMAILSGSGRSELEHEIAKLSEKLRLQERRLKKYEENQEQNEDTSEASATRLTEPEELLESPDIGPSA